jgi:hypothetical protein
VAANTTPAAAASTMIRRRLRPASTSGRGSADPRPDGWGAPSCGLGVAASADDPAFDAGAVIEPVANDSGNGNGGAPSG